VRLLPHFLTAWFGLLLFGSYRFDDSWRPEFWPHFLALTFACAFAWDRSLHTLLRRIGSPARWIVLSLVTLGVFAWLQLCLADASAKTQLILALALMPVGMMLRRLFVAAVRRSRRPAAEALRWLLLAWVCLHVIGPYATSALLGGGDAQHYARQLADVIAQRNQGIFPWFVGQSGFAFNGDIHPLRTAPYFQYVGALLDTLTAHRLGSVGVLNLLIMLSLGAGGFGCYLSALRLAGRRHAWTACLLAVAYVTSPGVLALVYDGDMIASWMTLPWLPLAFAAVARLWTEEAPAPALVQLATAMGAIWLAHPPIAFWTCFALGPALALWLAASVRQRVWLLAGAIACGAALAAYVFVSVLSLDMPSNPYLIQAARSGGLLESLKPGWAGLLRPVDPAGGNLLNDLQLSPVLWLALVSGGLLCLGSARTRKAGVAFLGCAGCLIALLYPQGEISARLWRWVPGAVINATEKWPMQRFYPILSALAPIVAALGLGVLKPSRRGVRLAMLCLLVAGCGWSLSESGKFVHYGKLVTHSAAETRQLLLVENAPLSRYSYEMYGQLPRYFSNGPVDAVLQNRLLSPDSLEPSLSNLGTVETWRRRQPQVTRHFQLDEFDAQLDAPLRLEPGKHYLFLWSGATPRLRGALQIRSDRLLREYQLPSSGEAQSFGIDSDHSRGFGLWTDGDQVEQVDVRIKQQDQALAGLNLGRVDLIELDQAPLPLRLTQLMPYQVETEAAVPGWLEMPKIHVQGYTATVDGKPVSIERSPDGLVMVWLPEGKHEVRLEFTASWPLRLAFWGSAAAWLALFAAAALPPLRRRWNQGLTFAGKALFPATAVAATLLLTWPWISAAKPAAGSAEEHLEVRLPIGREGSKDVLAERMIQQHRAALVVHYLDSRRASFDVLLDGKVQAASPAVRINYFLKQKLAITWCSRLEGNPEAARFRLALGPRILIDRTLPAGPTIGETHPAAVSPAMFVGAPKPVEP
jgi:hypothetical protein